MTARNAVRGIGTRLKNRRHPEREGFGPVVGGHEPSQPRGGEGHRPEQGRWGFGGGDLWSEQGPGRHQPPRDYAVGCVDPIDDDPPRMVRLPWFTPAEIVLLVSLAAMAGLLVYYGLGSLVGGK